MTDAPTPDWLEEIEEQVRQAESAGLNVLVLELRRLQQLLEEIVASGEGEILEKDSRGQPTGHIRFCRSCREKVELARNASFTAVV